MTKQITIIDGGPRKNMNTSAMIKSFAEGVAEGGAQVTVFRLYDLDFKGCRSCLVCKLKDRKPDVCAYKDGLTEALRAATYADGVVLASPVFFGRVTGQMECFVERLIFPWLSYDDHRLTPPRRLPWAAIYTMNDTSDNLRALRSFELLVGGYYGDLPEKVVAFNTYQVNDYDRYAMAAHPKEEKELWRAEHWENDLLEAKAAGRRMCEKIKNQI
ncbi:MAG: flavodoxin family protein [Bacteroidales bacterium]|nr:flavodoxin family protein [Bacteroidales bacterium]MBQ6741829.1 flavodoxin family protein [Bacteroidales bacterium]